MKFLHTEQLQREMCNHSNSAFDPVHESEKLGIAIQTIGQVPIYGVRKKSENGTCGWYIWSGDYSEADDFFKPLHVSHLHAMLPNVEKFLALAPGHKFIIDDEGYEDVWFDETLLDQ